MTSAAHVELPIYQVDAFADEVFSGNPAAVVPLEEWLPTETMQAIAAENNLSETAFFVPSAERTLIRWFTPAVEVVLCGHATLASAFVIATILQPETLRVRFVTTAGLELSVDKNGDLWELDFPALAPSEIPLDADLARALGGQPLLHHVANGRHLFVYDDSAAVAALSPDFARLRERSAYAIATAPGTDVDFVSRYFAAPAGIDEDPVTGSAHCVLIPYWAARLGKNTLTARQISRRGGRIWCELRGNRVGIAGRAALFLTGRIRVPLTARTSDALPQR
jgi:PhzF family phenazine biosynthesis protein